MARLIVLPPAEKYLKKIKDKRLKSAYKVAVDLLLQNPTAGTAKTGDLQGLWGYDIYYNKTNYELAYRIEYTDDTVVVVILAGTRENFYQELKRYITK